MIGRTLAIAALVGSATIDVVPLTHAEPAVLPELLQQASIITPEGVMVDPNNKEELKKYDNRHDLSELADQASLTCNIQPHKSGRSPSSHR